MAGVVGATLHYTASPVASGLPTIRAIARYQVGLAADLPQVEFPAIAYHLSVDGAGDVHLLHDLDVRVWHSGARPNGIARNATHVGIVYVGDHGPNIAQVDGLARALAWCEHQLRRELSVEGHRDAPYPTACPGPVWPLWRRPVLTAGAGFRGGPP